MTTLTHVRRTHTQLLFNQPSIIVKVKTFRINFKKVQEKIKFVKVHKSSEATLMSVIQSRSSSEDQSI